MNQAKLLIGALSIALTLTACGGGGDGAGTPGAGAGAGAGAGTGAGAGAGTGAGAATGSIASIVGDYPVRVVKADCDAENADGVTVAPQANGSCKITTPTSTEIRRDILPEGNYTLKITADGAMEMLQGTASKAKISCPPSPGICRVDATGGTSYIYTVIGASAGASVSSVLASVSQIILNASASAKSITTGYLYGLGANVTYAGSNPVLNGESGVLVLEPR